MGPVLVLVVIALCGGFFLVAGAVSFALSSNVAAHESSFRAAIGLALAYFASGLKSSKFDGSLALFTHSKNLADERRKAISELNIT